MAVQPIISNNKDLSLNRNKSNLKLGASIGNSTIDVYNSNHFAVDKVLCVGEFGSKGSELVLTSPSVAPSGNTVTLASALTKNHHKDSTVIILAYDKIEFLHAETVSGAKTQLSIAKNIDPSSEETLYEDSTYNTGYYFTRYYNSLTDTYSDYSDPVPSTGHPINTVGYAIDTAMKELNKSFSTILTYEMLISFTNQMLNLVRGKMKKWSNYQEFGYELGTLTRGANVFALPSDIYEKNTNKSILNVFIGAQTPITYISRSEFLQALETRVHVSIATQAEISDTSLVLSNTSNLPDEGTLIVFVSGEAYAVEFTANDKTTNTLTVAADQIIVQLPVSSDVWYNPEESAPRYYSIWDGNLYIYPTIDSTLEGQKIIMDYYTDIVSVDSDSDVIYGPRFDMLLHYLKFKIRSITENNGMENPNDPSHMMFREILADATRLEELGEVHTFRPRSKAIFGGRTHNSRR